MPITFFSFLKALGGEARIRSKRSVEAKVFAPTQCRSFIRQDFLYIWKWK
jgi:hypothetical protein